MKMAVNLTRLLALFSVFCVLAETAGSLHIENVKSWADELGRVLSEFFNNTTQYSKIQEDYHQSSKLSTIDRNGSAIAEKMKHRLEGILQGKIESIRNLASKAAELRKNYTYKTGSEIEQTEYFNTKDLTGLPLERDPKFSDKVAINKSSSVVHIPTDVYSRGVKILNTINWTDGLNKYFKENEQKDPSLLWQYFGSSDGVYRVYPGFEWRNSGTDVYDNRRRSWYIQGSSAPKDLIMVLDLSGSMAGQKLSILRLASLSLLETLQENDFVNIVAVYEGEPVMLCQLKKDGSRIPNDDMLTTECSRQLLQATAQNKKFLQQFIPQNTFAKGIAKASTGFQLAIDVLKDSREKQNFSSSNCTQAIVLFTDGMEDSQYELSKEIFNKENKDKKIHVFTYLVGSEKGAKFEPLKDISDTNGGCLFYIQTLSDVREKVLSYVSVLSRPLAFAKGGPDTSWTPIYLDQLGLGLMITLVAPVFNITSPEDKGQLLGVVGTDMPLPQLEGTVPLSEVGVNGYGFAINNNGFVVFHPGLNKKKDPPNIALNEVEYNQEGAKKLMREMIDRVTGNMKFKNRLISDDKLRLSLEDDFHFFYSPVDNTSFSAAVAIPNYGLKLLQAKGMNVDDADVETYLSSSKNDEDVIVAPWEICRGTPVAAKETTPVYKPSTPNATDIIDDTNRTNNCDKYKLQNLLFDANLTKERASKKWNAKKMEEDKIHSVFVATHGGIMRFLKTGSAAPFTTRDFMKEQFYKEAAQYAQKEKKGLVLSISYRGQNKGNQPASNESIVINASSAIVKDGVVAAVAGMQFDQEKMQEIFNTTAGSEVNCQDSEVYCRLINDDGLILASNQKDNEVGEFFGVPEGAVLKHFLNNSQFKEFNFSNIQGECKKPQKIVSSARTLLNPLFAVSSYVQFWTQTVFWSLMQFNIYSFFSRGNTALAEEEEEMKIPCTQELKFYKGENFTEKKEDDMVCPESDSNCDKLTWIVYPAPVKNTNLLLVIVTKNCQCEDNERIKVTLTPKDSVSSITEPRLMSYRKPPELESLCKAKGEGKPPCASASLCSPHLITLLILLTFSLLLPTNHHGR